MKLSPIALGWLALGSCLAQDAQRRLVDGEETASTIWKDKDMKGLEKFIEEKMKAWHAPGMAVAIVDGNSTWMKGFGFERNGFGPTSPKTLFFGGSTTKSFVAAALSQLVDDNEKQPEVQWTTPVSKLIQKDFVLSDVWSTSHITIEDCLSHRTGYPPHDLASWLDPKAAARGLRHLPMSAEPRTKFQYNNQMYTTMGYLVEQLSEGKWLGDVLRDKLWHPMGMKNTFLSIDDAKRNRASVADDLWYHNDTDSYVVVPRSPHRGHEGAGMILACVDDYAKYIRYMMNEEDGPISKAGYAAVKAPHMIVAGSHPQYTGAYYYGFGWFSGVIEGQQFWSHSGMMREHITQMWFFPNKQFGVVVMENANSPAIDLVLWKIIYDYLGTKEEDRYDVEKRVKDRIKTQEKALEDTIPRLYPAIPVPPLPRPLELKKYTGAFHNDGYGSFIITLACPDESDRKDKPQTPAHPTMEKGCYLRGNGTLEYDGKPFHLRFEHVTGDFWVGWIYIDLYVPKSEAMKDFVLRPQLGLKAQFELASEGIPVRFGADFRQEGEDGPLVWYERQDQEEKAEMVGEL